MIANKPRTFRPGRDSAADLEKKRQAVDEWNAQHQIGTAVIVQLDDESRYETKTASKAELLAGHTPVVWVDGIAGCYRLDRVQVRNDDLDPEAVRAELMKLFPNQAIGIGKLEIWIAWHHLNHKIEWNIHIGEPVFFRVSDVCGESGAETLREALEVIKTWKAQQGEKF